MKKTTNTTPTTNNVNKGFTPILNPAFSTKATAEKALKARKHVPNPYYKPKKTEVQKKVLEDVPYNVFSTESWKSFEKVLFGWLNPPVIPETFSDLVKRAEKEPTAENFRVISPIIVLCVLKRMMDVTPDNATVREMYHDVVKNPWTGLACDHVQTAFIELWNAFREEESFQYDLLKVHNIYHKYWLTRPITVKRATKRVVISDTLDTVATYKDEKTTALREIFHKVRQNIASYDSFKSYDGRYSFIELDSLDECNRIYQRLVYNIQTKEEEERLRITTVDLKLSPSETKVLNFRLRMPYAGHKVIANSLNLSQDTVKSALKRIREKALNNETLKNALNYNNGHAHWILANKMEEDDESTILRGSFDVETANKLSEMSNTPVHIVPQSDAEFTGADISIVANSYKVNLNKSTDYLNPPIFEHDGKLENISYATWMFANSHKGAIVIR